MLCENVYNFAIQFFSRIRNARIGNISALSASNFVSFTGGGLYMKKGAQIIFAFWSEMCREWEWKFPGISGMGMKIWAGTLSPSTSKNFNFGNFFSDFLNFFRFFRIWEFPMGMSGNGNRFFHPIFGNSGNGNRIRGNVNSHDWHISDSNISAALDHWDF